MYKTSKKQDEIQQLPKYLHNLLVSIKKGK